MPCQLFDQQIKIAGQGGFHEKLSSLRRPPATRRAFFLPEVFLEPIPVGRANRGANWDRLLLVRLDQFELGELVLGHPEVVSHFVEQRQRDLLPDLFMGVGDALDAALIENDPAGISSELSRPPFGS